ncbi:Bud site selection protein 6 [Yamadazyma tenuis]|uniref:Actin interacting protein 3 C-terminal domain-containing protein n=1 Tax=Candida tenuis (strain ATCC 10573 / BCRC 21748 / CBS 615 / JCM 9827 / NBRC 10315 / NRRL Y-1498 / VKM Y-70) TaxID=590646 RepID=G3B1Y0_CANTC|nr:uncharacterized protein CANTEDRAFT_133868 [Yamadazyma tenuis ATCC 10573]EGV64558.1 hypothetical protein CANTEDRAFT_133868 [Yamadazyma tenuis ATCC 10573]WEJ97321.1 Bud site selection protein 6 [Yamadazyma tenuis]
MSNSPAVSQGSKHSSKRHSTNSIESSVTRLLVSTKHLLESLTQWAKKEVDDKFVSDAYVKLGNDFRAASRAFNHAGVDISDIGDVPQALRVILESALSEAPSQENLNRFLPNIKNIIVSLLQNLKSKQNKAKLIAQDRDRSNSNSPPQDQKEQIKVIKRRQKSLESMSEDSSPQSIPQSRPQTQSIPPSQPPPLADPIANSIPKPSREKPEKKVSKEAKTERDALSQLQNESFLQRRASKRFSAYQYAKLANINPTNALPKVTPGDNRSVSIQSIRDSMRDRVSSSKTEVIDEFQKEDTYIFLKIEDQTKKAPIKMPVSFASLRLLFVEKFAYSPGASDFPEIYIVDPKTNVSYELEDQYLSDIKTGTLLCLNESKTYSNGKDSDAAADDTGSLTLDDSTHNNQSFKELEQTVSELKSKFDSFGGLIEATIKSSMKSIEIPMISAQQPTPIPSASLKNDQDSSVSNISRNGLATKNTEIPSELIKEVSSIENELKVIRQLQGANKSVVSTFVKNIDSKVKHLQESGIDATKSSNRIYMEKCHGRLSEESDSLLTKVDDLQDVMEGLRKDVAQRGVRVGAQQLKATMKEIVAAGDSLKDMSSFINKEKTVWKKIWEAELDRVCEEQQFFNLQDDLTKDLEEDLAKIQETFDLVEQCSLEQSKQSSYRRNKVVANLPIPEPGENLHSIKDAVLSEVAALKPDHESRVDAINKAEKLRQKNKQMMDLTEFQEELGSFIDDSKLRKSGGIDEIERQRQLKDSENLKSSMGGII